VITDIGYGTRDCLEWVHVRMMSTYDVKVRGCLLTSEHEKTIRLKLTVLAGSYLQRTSRGGHAPHLRASSRSAYSPPHLRAAGQPLVQCADP
jgi:hypothetical protein